MDDRHSIGGNQPPEPTPIERNAQLVETCNRWVTVRGTITDEEVAGVAQEFVTQLRSNRDQLEAEKKAKAEPLKRQLGEIDREYAKPIRSAGIALEAMLGMLTPFMKAKAERAKREVEERVQAAAAAQRQAALAADRAAQEKTVEAELERQEAVEAAEEAQHWADRKPAPVRVKGDLAPKAMALKTYWHAEIEDETKALRHFAKFAAVREAALTEVKRLCNRLARESKDEAAAPPGVRFVKREVAQ